MIKNGFLVCCVSCAVSIRYKAWFHTRVNALVRVPAEASCGSLHLYLVLEFSLFIWTLMCMDVLLTCVYANHMCAWCLVSSEVSSPGTRLKDNCELPHLVPGALQKQQVLLPETSIQPLVLFLVCLRQGLIVWLWLTWSSPWRPGSSWTYSGLPGFVTQSSLYL